MNGVTTATPMFFMKLHANIAVSQCLFTWSTLKPSKTSESAMRPDTQGESMHFSTQLVILTYTWCCSSNCCKKWASICARWPTNPAREVPNASGKPVCNPKSSGVFRKCCNAC